MIFWRVFCGIYLESIMIINTKFIMAVIVMFSSAFEVRAQTPAARPFGGKWPAPQPNPNSQHTPSQIAQQYANCKATAEAQYEYCIGTPIGWPDV